MDESDAAAANAAASAAAKLKARSGGRRRSCNRCSAKKERCDGQEPCQRCTRSGLECLYASCRTLGRPRNASPPVKRRSKAAAAAAAAAVGAAGGGGTTAAAPRVRNGGRGAAPGKKGRNGGSPAATQARGVTPGRSQGAGEVTVRSRKVGAGYGPDGSASRARPNSAGVGAAAPATSALKRLSLSPSPATGLTGLVQNKYLTCFVDDFSGFFQVLDEVTIRLGLINLMSGKVDPTELVEASNDPHPVPKRRRNGSGAASPHRYVPSPPQAGGQQSQQVSSETVEAVSAAATAAEEEQEVVNAINSSVFSAMSLGAMLLGQPPSHVHIYVAVAEASLRLCGVTEHLTMAVPNEHVAAAALLLAFAANISGREEYRLHIHLARQCYDRRVRHGLPTPQPIRDSLGYRAIIDALGKPPDDRGLRIPSPSKELRVPQPAPSQSSCPSQESGGGSGNGSGDGGGSSGDSSSDNGGGSSMASPRAGGGLDGQPLTRGGDAATGAASGGGGGATASQETAPARNDVMEKSGPTQPPGLEAARERQRLRQADPMSMVSDIMAMLSRVPWTANVEAAARRTKRELRELRALMVAEKALAEERRFASGSTKRRTDGVAVFALASASIGLHCALDEFLELLRLGREVASCIHCCPGLARYQPHAYHAGLVILAAFGKRKEFEDLLRAAPTELRLSASNGRPLTYEAHSDTCSHPVCRKHAKAISEMGRHLRSEEGEPRITTSSVTVEEVGTGEAEKGGENHGGAAEGQAEMRSMSGKVLIRRASPEAAADTPPSHSPGATAKDKFTALVMRLPSPPESPGLTPPYDDGLPQQGSSLRGPAAAAAAARRLECAADHTAAGAEGTDPRQVGAAGVGAGENRAWSPEYTSSWSTPPPASSTCGNDPTKFSSPAAALSSASSFGESGGVVNSSPARLNDMGLGVLSAAATAMAATPAQPAAASGGLARGRRDESGGLASAGNSNSGSSGLQASKRSRVAMSTSAAANNATAAVSGEGIPAGTRSAHAGTALQATARKSGANGTTAVSSSTGSTRPLGGAYSSYQPQRHGSSSSSSSSSGSKSARPPPANPSPDDRARAAEMMVMSQRQPVTAPAAQAAAAVNGSGVHAIHAAAPAGGTLTWRLWGAPRSSLAGVPSSGLPTSGGSGGGGGSSSAVGLYSPSLHNHPPVASPGVPRPWQWHGAVPPSAAFAPTGPSALSVNLLGGTAAIPSAAAAAAMFPVSAQQGLSRTGVVQVMGTGVAAAPGFGVSSSTPSTSSFATTERSTAVAVTAPAVSSRRPMMTAGEASAAAISLASMAGAGSANHGGSATGPRKGAASSAVAVAAPAANAPAANAPAASAPAANAPAGVHGVSGGVAGVEEAGCVEPHEEEMMALWEIIGTGDSE